METTTRIPDPHVLAKVFGRFAGIDAVYLFGSRAAGNIRSDSDIDLAIVARSTAVRERRLDILADLARYGFDNVDLVFLDADDIVLNYEAVRQNQLVYQSEDFSRGGMYSKVVRRYLDFLPYLQVQREAYKRRILRGQT